MVAAPQSYADPAQRAEFQRLIEEHGFVTDFVYEVRRKDGRAICVSENVRLTRDAAGQPLYYEGSVQDITEQKRAERESGEAEQATGGKLARGRHGRGRHERAA